MAIITPERYLLALHKMPVLLNALFHGVLPDQWQRTGVYSSYGADTLLEFTTHAVWHDLNHIEQIARTLKLSEALV